MLNQLSEVLSEQYSLLSLLAALSTCPSVLPMYIDFEVHIMFMSIRCSRQVTDLLPVVSACLPVLLESLIVLATC